MTLEERYKKTNDSTYNDRILKAIRQNLNKYKFKTQEEILIFLEKKNLSTTQPTLSRILRANNIIKNSSGIYEDIDEKITRARGIIFNSYKEVLMCYLNGCNHYEFPCGHIEFGENLIEGLKQELFEETGIEIEEKNIAI